VSSDITRVGPPDENDFPPERGLIERIWRDSWYCNLASRTFGLFFLFGRGAAKMDESEHAGDEPPPADQPWHGLPEAELTKEQRREAMERLSRE
jgi:hypothetical protein